MRLTVNEALSVYPLTEARLIAGAKGTDNMVQSINIMDAPDIADWIKPGELLFTTAYVLKDNPEDVIAFIRKLKTRGCVGLGIKLGRFWREIPQRVIEEADRMGFPLLALPYQFTFSDQMNALFNAEHKKHTRLLQSVLRKQRELMKYALQQDGDPEMFGVISQILACPMAVVSVTGQVFYNSSAIPDAALTLGMPWKKKAQWIRQGPCYRIPLMQEGECFGFFLVFPGDSRSLKVEEGLFHQAAEIIAFSLGRSYRKLADSAAQHETGALINQYLQRQIPVQALIDHGGFHFPSGPFQCVWIAANHADPSGPASLSLRHIRHQLRYHPQLRKFAAQHFEMKDGIFSIYSFPADQKGAEPWFRCLSHIVDPEKTEGYAADRLQWFISRMKMTPDRLYEAYEECRAAQRLADRHKLSGRLISYETVEFAVVFQHVPQEKMKAYCDKLLHPLLVKDEEYVQEMLATLEVYIHRNGSLHETAKELHIHRNTVAYRLDKISETLKLDLKNYNDLAKLKLMFTFRNFLGKERSG